MNKKIDVFLITGFLGSGKTTLLNNFIRQTRDKNIGIIINDFGKINIDVNIIKHRNKDIISNNKIKITDIKNGSIFCSCLESVFIEGLKFYTKVLPHFLFIETSGLSDPTSMNKIINTIKELTEYYKNIYTICILDPTKFLKLVDTLLAIQRQVISADIVIINKIDQVNEKTINSVEKKILSLNPKVKIVKTLFANVNIEDIMTNTKFLEKSANSTLLSCNTVKNRPGVLLLKKRDISLNKLKIFLDKIKNNVFRIKGFVEIDKKVYFITDNNNKIFIKKQSNKVLKDTGITIICPPEQKTDIENIWNEV